MVFRGGKELCNHLETPYDVQRCKISDESVRHALPMGEHIHIFAARSVIRLRVHCRRLHLNALWMLNGVSVGFFFFLERGSGGCVIRGWERTWTALQLFHCFSRASQHGTSPAHFGLHIKGKHNAQYDSIRNKCWHVRLYSPCYLIVTRGANRTPLKTTWTTVLSSCNTS